MVYLYAYRKLYEQEVPMRLDVVVKNKTPVQEKHVTTRMQDQFHRMVELVKRVESDVVPPESRFPVSGRSTRRSGPTSYSQGAFHLEPAACRSEAQREDGSPWGDGERPAGDSGLHVPAFRSPALRCRLRPSG